MNFTSKQHKGYGSFGNLSAAYSSFRKGFPEDVIDYIFTRIGVSTPKVLDIGCGTGIATSQLHKRGADVRGSDSDPRMIKEAKLQDKYSIQYVVASAEGQPFDDSVFDAVTAFSAFHWFATPEAVREIQRVLKLGGYFFAINKNEVGDFKKNNKKILLQFAQEEIPDVKKTYEPESALSQYGIENVEKRVFPTTEYYSPEEALGYVQTMSFWNLVPDELKNDAKDKFSEHFKQRVGNNGKVTREIDVVVVSGRNS